ncbi:hypothetical protein BGX23_010034 [Mortierella sp. AD031]|nr:hypothetical protein BGX23_010034 [Mortierella sp. AD031]
MASILFDDITFPRELYDPDTFEFVAPVSTLLTFTPHIISQLAKTSEEQQEPLPIPNPIPAPSTTDNTETASASASSGQTANAESSGGVFSTFKNFASSHSAQRILDNGLYLAGRYMDGSAASASARRSSYENDHRYDTRSRQSASSSSNNWFGSSSSSHYDYRDQERQRLRDMEERLRQMERDMRQQSAMARSEVDAQRRQRVQLEQELESQKQKVKRLETEVEQKQKEQEADRKKQEEDKKKKKQEEEVAAAEKKKKKASAGTTANEDEDTESATLLKKENADSSSSTEVVKSDANAVLMATVGVASLVMSLYAAHKASSIYSVVRFHDQLELLISQCEGVIQSTEAWMSEQFLEVPAQIRQDLKMLKELIETIQRLDPRSEKKAETVAWSMSAVGSIGAVGGAVIGSMTAMASGGTLVVGCALYGIISRARYSGPEYNAARTMMEVRVIQILKSLGVNPSAASSTSSQGGRTSLIHESRLERLRIEFERREGLEIGDANEIDGLAVEEALLESSFSAPFVSQRSSTSTAAAAARSRQQSGATAALEDAQPSLTLKSEPKRVSVHA